MNITYTEKDGIFYPNLALPQEEIYDIGKYGHLRLNFLKHHRRATYTSLLTEGKLNEHTSQMLKLEYFILYHTFFYFATG